jgi:hypothetical protein
MKRIAMGLLMTLPIAVSASFVHAADGGTGTDPLAFPNEKYTVVTKTV